jgi:hypothetical protein
VTAFVKVIVLAQGENLNVLIRSLIGSNRSAPT